MLLPGNGGAAASAPTTPPSVVLPTPANKVDLAGREAAGRMGGLVTGSPPCGEGVDPG